MNHIAGNRLYVDFAGGKLYLSKDNAGDETPVKVFATIYPCSQITYYGAVPSPKKEYLIQACENDFHYFGDVHNAIATDNPDIRWTHRIYPDGMWEANLYQYYVRVYNRLIQSLPVRS